ncbi:MAG: ABC transporter permease subunit [Candidatus Rokubacteria bacterium]|nr:ABC transporter permease subunit [Candidatus Rokubacteria bacterium]
MVARFGSTRLRRTLLALLALAVFYGVASEIGSRVLPRRVWVAVHYVEGVELLPPYASLAEEAVFLVRSGILGGGVLVTGGRVLLGVAAGALVGIPLGLAMALRARVEFLAEPWVVFFRFTPALALLPLYVLWFGLGELPKILLVATGVAIVTLQGAFEGARSAAAVHLHAAAALGTPPSMVVRRIILPAAVPAVLSSLRIATALAWVTVVVAELIKPTMPSLGYLLALGGAYPRVPTIVLAIATIGVLVLVSDGIVLGTYRRSTRWMRRRVA